jgi:hypothetical protein
MVSDEQSATKWSSEAINLAPTSRSMGSSRCMARRDMADDCARDSRESNGEKKSFTIENRRAVACDWRRFGLSPRHGSSRFSALGIKHRNVLNDSTKLECWTKSSTHHASCPLNVDTATINIIVFHIPPPCHPGRS